MKPTSILLNRWLIGFAVSLAMVARFFYAEVVRHAGDGFHDAGPLGEIQAGLTPAELANVTGFKLAPLENNLDQVHVRHVHVVERDDATRTLAFDLVSDVPGNDYPELQVRVLSSTGQELRSVLLPAESYHHGHSLVDEEVRLRIPKIEGGSRISIDPVYGSRAAGAAGSA